jgi:hypothetical protein
MRRARTTSIAWYSETFDGTEREYEVRGHCIPGEPDVWYLKNGDPGYPGSPPEVDDVSLWMDGKEIPEADWEKHGFVWEKLRNRIEDDLFERAAEDDQSDYEDAQENRRDD